MLSKPLDQITPTDLQALVGKVPERRDLEYKEILPGRSEEDRKEFLRDVSSLANAVGGYLIYGVRERRDNGIPTGIPEAIVGLGTVNAGAAINTLENVIRNGVSPPLYVASREIRCQAGPVIVLYIPRSVSSPHMVTQGGDGGFYTRSSAGKYKLSVDEIRNAFLELDSLGERLEAFRRGRIVRIIAGDTPVPLEAGPRLVVHVIPYSAESGIGRVTVPLMESQTTQLRPIVSGGGWNPIYNYEGFATYSSRRDREDAYGYVQVFRTGALEVVDCVTLSRGNSQIPGAAFEIRMVESVGQYLKVEHDLGLAPPIVVAITLLGVRGFVMAEDKDPFHWRQPQPINRDEVALPEIVVTEYGVKPQDVLRHAFDVLWQTAGWPRSIYFDEDGNWKPSR